MEEQLLEILREDILATEDPLTTESDLFVAGLDSMAIMQLILALEDRFDVTIDPTEISRENFATPARIASLVRSKQNPET